MAYEYTCTGGSSEHEAHTVIVDETGIAAEEPVEGDDSITASGSVIDEIELKAGDIFITCPICGEKHGVGADLLRDKVLAYQGMAIQAQKAAIPL